MYIGVPFCPTRCAYCSFVSQSVEKSFSLVDPYVDALVAEIEAGDRPSRRPTGAPPAPGGAGAPGEAGQRVREDMERMREYMRRQRETEGG